ncbi:MAG: hypothetical protein ACYTEZ_17100 [Planctomycetota bacterium]|jgi:hypothetical protein
MRCFICQQHATFDHTVFQGTSPTTVRLCPDCSVKVQAEQHVANIKSAPDRNAKNAAIAEFLRAIGK